MRASFIALASLALTLHCSSSEVVNRYDSCEKIAIGPGTEDFALSPSTDTIFVSSHERRKWTTPGDIYTYAVKTRVVKKLTRSGEPTDVFFSPHGIDLYEQGRDRYLYVVNHGKELNDADQSILIYRISGDSLVFVTRVRSEFINSPNDVAVAENGSFYVTNDHGSRGSMWEILWGLRRSKIAFCTLSGLNANSSATCVVAADGVAMANGPLVRGDKVYVTATRDDALFEFKRNADGTLSDKRKLASLAGPDNLSWHEQSLITASHTSNWKFYRHFKNASNHAPSYIAAIKAEGGEITPLYFNAGERISAASGAFVYQSRLYISQVFEDAIFECQPVR